MNKMRRRKPWFCLAVAWFALSGAGSSAAPATLPPGRDSVLDLSLEELANLEISSVSKRLERLIDAAASIYVITGEDIRRAGAASLPEALRLAPNLEVAQVDASQQAISSRGFNSTTANKLLVLLDGRSLYTALYSGVFWDVQDTLLDDIERIEVISGPGATLWGANAVNGVINIITRDARKTPGTLLAAGGGSWERGSVAVRHGGRLSGDGAWRAYAKYFDRDGTRRQNGNPGRDAWHFGQVGFRGDQEHGRDALTWQGDAYSGRIDQLLPGEKRVSGGNLLVRWTRSLPDEAKLQLQVYYDHTRRVYPGTYGERRDTFDLDVHHTFLPAERHETIWGLGYRASRDHVDHTAGLAFLPADTLLRQLGLFAQHTYHWVPDRWAATIGLRLDRNDFSGTDAQPSLRLSWKPDRDQLWWTAVSRAARAPSRIDRDFYTPATPPYLLAGGPGFESEIARVVELGYRTSLDGAGSLSLTLFRHNYEKLRSVQPITSRPFPAVLQNRIEGHARGFEIWGDYRFTNAVRLHAGYARLRKSFHMQAGAAHDPSGVAGGSDPKRQFLLRLALDLTPELEVDANFRAVGAIAVPSVPAYENLDLRVGWTPRRNLEVSLLGRNLLDRRHPEAGDAQSQQSRSEMARMIYARVVWKF